MNPYSPVRMAARLLRSADVARAYTLATLLAAFGSHAVERTAGRVTLATVIVSLVVLGIGIIAARRRELRPLGFAPTSFVVFLVWALVSTIWSNDDDATLGEWMSLVAYGFLALVIAHIRDTLQTVRAIGDVLRWLLAASLALEILSGILLDMPFPFLGIAGQIANGGPIQGLFGTRNMLGFVAIVALVTFLVEWRTQSVPPQKAAFSITLAALLAVLSASPTAVVLALSVAVALLALTLVRRAAPERRRSLQWTLAIALVLSLSIAYALRHPILRWLDATAGFSLRADLWNAILTWVGNRPIQGFGWHGGWDADAYPMNVINVLLGESHRSALNAYFDVLLQLGWVGLLLFAALCGVAFVRSWLVASERKSTVYAWTPAVLAALIVDSMFESFTLEGAGWLLLVLCAVRAGQSRSWRESLDLVASGGESQDPLAPPR
ncbi:O-antigen ligase family protein [Microbacterium sp. JZ37]|uniref:O-antigen ligase family protein n=1 Tax=Microbacterium sp. JZ37 TaxID=2654193 RepID=UPI002B48233A|nr:O-antigen ligase family protein [Microbacterium sp. JZ37]WRH16926.1 O-antigen ligase family protein [Microbacterium sp. JZ37]